MASTHIKNTNDGQFETDVLQSGLPALVDFWAVWCGPCKALSPVIDALAEDYAGKINVFKLNIDDNPETPAKYGVRGIPTVIFFKDGQIFKQSVGVVPKAELQKIIDGMLA